jgi:hypothetical protein
MTDDTATKVPHRREVLRTLGGATTMAAAMVAAPLTAAIPAQAQTARDDRKKARYRESEHTKAYYRTNRY